MTHVLVAPDKFKGSLSAAQVAAHVVAGLRDGGLPATALPVADGGEGTIDAALAGGSRRLPVLVNGPTGEQVEAAIAVGHGTAVVELAAASGLALLPGGRPDPLGATSRGTGELVRAALDAGCRRVVLGVGGSACTDGGAGLLAALGARLLDASGAPLPDGGGALRGLAGVDLAGLDPRLARTEVVLASDVDNPLLGTDGAAAVYGPQKGASPADVAALEAGLAHWATLLGGGAARPGAGAAGGVGYAAQAVLGARRRPGIEVVLDLIGFAERLRGACLVVTGEGSLDAQTLHGKAPLGVAAGARAAGVPVTAVCGRCTVDHDRLAAAGIGEVHALADLEPDLARCIAEPGPLLRRIGRRLARTGTRPANVTAPPGLRAGLGPVGGVAPVSPARAAARTSGTSARCRGRTSSP